MNKAIREALQSAARLQQAGDPARAEQTCLQILRVQPTCADALHLLAIIDCQRGRFEPAIDSLQKAIALAPKESGYHNSLGNALRGMQRLSEAVASYRQACALSSANLAAMNNLGMALDEADQTEESLACFDRLIATKADVAEWHVNRGTVQFNAGLLPEAIESQRRAISLQPQLAGAHIKLATALLASGQFTEGWREYAWRFRTGVIADPTAGDPAPVWEGSPIDSQTLLVHCEQGFGDAFQCARYLPMLAGKGARVLVRCQPEIQKLIERVPGVHQAVAIGQPVPPHDWQVPIFSLPLLFNTTEATIPRDVPYIFCDPQKADGFRSTDHRKRVGVVWTGSGSQGSNRRRSCPAEELNELASVDQIDFYRLQLPVNLPAPSALKLIDFTSSLKDFDDTAALISNLDLVISVDTSVAHLAGAMGKPVWIILPFAAEWRWLRDREDSPWYPSARLFRQAAPGDWRGVMQRVRAALGIMAVQE